MQGLVTPRSSPPAAWPARNEAPGRQGTLPGWTPRQRLAVFAAAVVGTAAILIAMKYFFISQFLDFGTPAKLVFLSLWAAVVGVAWATTRPPGGRAILVTILALVVIVPNVLVSPWPYEVERVANHLKMPPGWIRKEIQRGELPHCCVETFLAVSRYSYPAGTNITTLTLDITQDLRDDGWHVARADPPRWNMPHDAWLPYGWIEAEAHGIQLLIFVGVLDLEGVPPTEPVPVRIEWT